MVTSAARHVRARVALFLACALVLPACGDADEDVSPRNRAWAPDPDRAAEAGRMSPEDLQDAIDGWNHAHDGENAHEHGLEHGHSHDGDELGPPPVDVGPAERRAADGGLIVRLSRIDEPDFGFVEVRRGAALEVRLARDRDLTRPFRIPTDAVIELRFADHPTRAIALRAPKDAQPKASRFAAPEPTPEQAAWMQGAPLVRLALQVDGETFVTDDFLLRAR